MNLNKNHILGFISMILLWTNGLVLGQTTSQNKYPFILTALNKLTISIDIVPTFKDGKFSFFNLKSGERAFKRSFDIAYPFVGKSAVVMTNGKYGLIDKKGDFVEEPTNYYFAR